MKGGFTVIKHSEVSSNGFTIIELLITISIVVVLATLALTNYAAQLPKGRDVKRKDNLSQIRRALEDYSTDERAGCYPASLPACNQRFEKAGKVYLPSVPCDPRTNQPYLYSPTPLGSCPTSYWLYATLEYDKDPGIEKTGCAGGCGPANAYNFKIGSPNAE